MVKNENYEKELKEWSTGLRSGDSVGIVGWFDEHKNVAIHDCVLRYDLFHKPQSDIYQNFYDEQRKITDEMFESYNNFGEIVGEL